MAVKRRSGGRKGKVAKPVRKYPVKRDPVIEAIGKDIRSSSRSSMFQISGEALSRSKLVRLDEEAKEDFLKSYYKNMVFRCVKCDGVFDHQASLPPVEYEIKCPHCSEIHLLKFMPASKLFTVHSKTVDVVEDKKRV